MITRTSCELPPSKGGTRCIVNIMAVGTEKADKYGTVKPTRNGHHLHVRLKAIKTLKGKVALQRHRGLTQSLGLSIP